MQMQSQWSTVMVMIIVSWNHCGHLTAPGVPPHTPLFPSPASFSVLPGTMGLFPVLQDTSCRYKLEKVHYSDTDC